MFLAVNALAETLVNLAIWLVLFPGLVTALIAFAIAQGIGERAENRRRRQGGNS